MLLDPNPPGGAYDARKRSLTPQHGDETKIVKQQTTKKITL